ncbi:MAG: ATP-binding protein [Anaerolineae bacterium]|jgi:signal transduction histidine kinase
MAALLETAPLARLGQRFNRLNWMRILIVLAAAAVLALQVLAGYGESQRRTIRYSAGIGLDVNLRVTRVDGSAKAVGFQVGDYVRELAGRRVENIVEYRRAIDPLAAGSPVVVGVQRGTELVRLPSVEVGNILLDGGFYALHLVAIAFLALATWVALVRSENLAARLFFLASLALALYFALTRTHVEGLVYVYAVALAFAPALAIHFFLVFPREKGLARSPWIGLLYLPSLALAVLMFRSYAQAVEMGAGIYYAPDYQFLSNRVGLGYLTLSAIFGIAMLGHAYVTTAQSVQKRQIQWIMLGLVSAVLVAAVDITLTVLQEQQSPEITMWVILGVLPVPLAFAFAVLRYRLWNMDVVLSRSAVYGLLTAALAAIYLSLISILSNALGVAAGSERYTAVLFVSALVIGILVNPSRAWIQRAIDRLFFRNELDYQNALAAWSEDLSTSLRFADLGHLLLRRVPEQLGIAQASLLVLSEDEKLFEPLEPLAGAYGAGDRSEEPSLPAYSAIAVQLARQGRTVLIEHEEARSIHMTDATLEDWRKQGVCVVLPLVSGGRLVGIYLLGRKRSGDLYQSRELEVLRTLSNQAATAIANARFYEQVHGLSQELELKVQDRTKELRHFLSAVYHELSTPMTSIRGYTSVLLDEKAGPLTDRQERYLQAVRRNVRRLMRLVGDLADVSGIEDGRLTIQPKEVDLENLIVESLEAHANLIDDKGLQVSISVESDARMVLGDRQRLLQILSNLLSNACRYTPAGGRITVSAQCLDDRMELVVQDTGIGIHKDELERIFDRFYRSSDPLVQEQPGTGLGLAITKSLVELHGSQLWVNSTAGEGSTFGFSLPLAAEPQVDHSARGEVATLSSWHSDLDQRHAPKEEDRGRSAAHTD